MTNRLPLSKWRAITRRLATNPTLSSDELATAIRLRMCIDSLSLPHEDRMIKPDRLAPRSNEHWAWIIANSEPLVQPKATLYTIADVTDPAKFPDPVFRVTALMQVFAAVMAGLIVITETVQQVFRRTATDDPDPRVRAWALFLIDPDNHPRPDDE